MVDSKQQWKAWLYLSPAIVLLLIFTVWPIINTLRMAFLNDYNIAETKKSYSVGDVITVYGNFSYQEGTWAVTDSDSRFLAGDSVFYIEGDSASKTARDNNQKQIINDIKHLASGEKLEVKKGLVCEITDIKKSYNVNTMKMSVYAEAVVGTTKIKVVCSNIKRLDLEFKLDSLIYLTGEVKKTSTTNTGYLLENGSYEMEYDLSTSERTTYDNARIGLVDDIKNLNVGSTATNATYRSFVYGIESIDSDDKVTIVCQVLDSSSKSYFITCSGLNASEQSGLTFEGFHLGFVNFQKVVNYAQFGTCLKNTLLLCVLTVPLSTLLALVISVCLNSIKVFQRFLQTIYFLPYVTNSIAIGMVFATMFNIVGLQPGFEATSVGIVNNVIEFFGGTRINWMNVGSTYGANLAVMIIYIVWNALPFKILILLGGLQSVNKQYYDAAKIDGTSKWRTFWRITVPLLSPMIAYVIITGFIGGFKEYSSIVGVFGESMGPPGDPIAGGSLNTMVGYIYNAIKDHQGRASAASLILFGIILVVTLINLKVSSKKVTY